MKSFTIAEGTKRLTENAFDALWEWSILRDSNYGIEERAEAAGELFSIIFNWQLKSNQN